MHRTGFYSFGAAALLCAATSAVALAQEAATTPTGVPGIAVVAPPPPGFDAVNASPSVRAHFAMPPAPDPRISPHEFGVWKRAMSAPQHRETPTVEETGLFHGPLQRFGERHSIAAHSVASQSTNWSGSAVTDPGFSTTTAIVGEFVVPTAHQAFGACTGGWDYSAHWVGIDGDGSNDVLQAGTEADAFCNGSSTMTNYYAWIEWFPHASVKVGSPAIHPGDLIFVEVWSTSATTGNAFIFNISTQTSATYNLTAPRRTTLKSNSVEWIVERPALGTGLTNLMNYLGIAFPEGFAWDTSLSTPTYDWLAADPAAGTLELITMVDNNGSPISTPTPEGPYFLWFADSGSACSTSTGTQC
jgi:hypothetical protein